LGKIVAAKMNTIRDGERMNPTFCALLDAGTAVISDIFDTMNQMPLVLDNQILPITGENCRLVGPAYTITGETCYCVGGGDRPKLEAIDHMPEGVVAIWAGTDIRGVCCFGDLLASAMKARGVAAAVVDGGVRDTPFIKGMGLPVLARYHTPAQAIGRWRVTARQVPVQVRGALQDWVSVHPGDIVVADEDGVIVVPGEMLDRVAQRVGEWSQKDSRAREDIAKGLPLIQALAKYGHL
jgi:4-hydroxy-4-methyl-2-oxoglutarate aldolase